MTMAPLPWVSYEHGRVIEVRCPVCGNPIRVMATGNVHSSRKIGNQVIVERHVELVCLPNYREYHAEMVDPAGNLSKHVQGICSVCADRLTVDIANEIYQADPGTQDNPMAMRIVTTILDINQGGVP